MAPGLRGTSIEIRVATLEDILDIRAIEHAARERFRNLPLMTRIAKMAPHPPEHFADKIDIGGIFVATSRFTSCKSTLNDSGTIGDRIPEGKTRPTIVGWIDVMSPVDTGRLDISELINSKFPRFFINGVHVPLLYERQGIGRQLVRYIEDAAKEAGARAIDAMVMRDVPWCHGFCESIGFSQRHWMELEDNLYGKYLVGLRRLTEEGTLGEFEWVAMRKLLV